MPGFGEMLSENQLWQVSLMLSQADKLPVGTKGALNRLQPAQTPSTSPAVAPTAGAEHKHYHDNDH